MVENGKVKSLGFRGCCSNLFSNGGVSSVLWLCLERLSLRLPTAVQESLGVRAASLDETLGIWNSEYNLDLMVAASRPNTAHVTSASTPGTGWGQLANMSSCNLIGSVTCYLEKMIFGLSCSAFQAKMCRVPCVALNFREQMHL